MDVAYNPGAWHDFGGAFVGAIAALLGLVFVVVSIHLRAVIDDPVLRRRAEIMLGLLATMLAASTALLIPGQSREALAIELMPIALVYITLSGVATFRATHSPRGVTRDRLARFFIGGLAPAWSSPAGWGYSCTLSEAHIWSERASSSACSSRCSQSGPSSSASGSNSGTLSVNGGSGTVISRPTRSRTPVSKRRAASQCIRPDASTCRRYRNARDAIVSAQPCRCWVGLAASMSTPASHRWMRAANRKRAQPSSATRVVRRVQPERRSATASGSRARSDRVH